MNTKTIVVTAILGIVAIGVLVYAGNGENENKRKVALTEMPGAVQKTIQDNLGGGTIIETAKEIKGGKTYYDARVQKSGGAKVEIKVEPNGNLIGVGKEEDDDD